MAGPDTVLSTASIELLHKESNVLPTKPIDATDVSISSKSLGLPTQGHKPLYGKDLKP